MLLKQAKVTNYKSIEDSGLVEIDPDVTTLVGQNESGKSAFLESLHKCSPAEFDDGFNFIEDYPRRRLSEYERAHEVSPEVVVTLFYQLEDEEIRTINQDIGIDIVSSPDFKVEFLYDNNKRCNIEISELSFINYLKSHPVSTGGFLEKLNDSASLRDFITASEGTDLNTEQKEFVRELKVKYLTSIPDDDNLLNNYVKKVHIIPKLPKFVFFDEYHFLPGKINLQHLQQNINSNNLNPEDRTVLALLRLANVNLSDISKPTGYESSKARLEGISNKISDKLFEYWKQTNDQDLSVIFDIKPDETDTQPYNNGNNLYIRIWNPRHRVSVPFNQRSKGFRWFFSFLVLFDSIAEEIKSSTDLILLLDEPGLSLHGLAQKDLLSYIDNLGQDHQTIYTTHSPFMVDSGKLSRVRVVEDRDRKGTKISSNIQGSDRKTLFPLQAALGYDIAQNLFISRRNLIVEGTADLVFLQFFSALLEKNQKESLRDDIIIIPVGGLDKIASFVALLGASDLELVVIHDYYQQPDQRIKSLIVDKIVPQAKILDFSQFRDPPKGQSGTTMDTDIEDLIPPDLYLSAFNDAYKIELSGKEILEGDLPMGDRIISRINQYLEGNSIVLRPSGGFNHLRVAHQFSSSPAKQYKFSTKTIAGFEGMFKKINSLFS